VHSEGTPPPGRYDAGGYAERAETYLRLLAEAALRPAADGHANRVRRAADVLVEAGVLPEQVAAQILADLQLSLRLRGRDEVIATGSRLPRLSGSQPRGTPGYAGGEADPWRVLQSGPPTPGSRPMALILVADKALAPMTLYFPPAAGPSGSGLHAFAGLTATDDLGTRYRLGFTDGSWAGSAWTGTVIFFPRPPAAASSLEITSPNGRLLLFGITTAPAGSTAPSLVLSSVTESPGERLLTRRAEAMLAALALGVRASRSPAQSDLAELASMLEAAGVLSPISPVPARLAALGQLLGLPMEGPASEVPARWTDVIAHYGRRRRLAPVTGTAAIGATAPEIDGARFAIAGLRSGGSGSFLHIVIRGLRRPMPRRRDPGVTWDAGANWDAGFSWWARDDAGGWHLGAVEDVSPVGGPEGLLRLALLPPLGHATTTLTVEVTGGAQRITANLPVRW
jgi:hypothetical protein